MLTTLIRIPPLLDDHRLRLKDNKPISIQIKTLPRTPKLKNEKDFLNFLDSVVDKTLQTLLQFEAAVDLLLDRISLKLQEVPEEKG